MHDSQGAPSVVVEEIHQLAVLVLHEFLGQLDELGVLDQRHRNLPQRGTIQVVAHGFGGGHERVSGASVNRNIHCGALSGDRHNAQHRGQHFLVAAGDNALIVSGRNRIATISRRTNVEVGSVRRFDFDAAPIFRQQVLDCASVAGLIPPRESLGFIVAARLDDGGSFHLGNRDNRVNRLVQ